jgi:class 3 adenylate cyclase
MAIGQGHSTAGDGLMVDQPTPVSLTDAVQAVRSALVAAVMDEGLEDFQFALGSVELEFAIDVRPAADGNVQILVLSAGADGSTPAGRRHRVRVTLDPVDTSGRSLKIRRGLGGDRPGD